MAEIVESMQGNGHIVRTDKTDDRSALAILNRKIADEGWLAVYDDGKTAALIGHGRRLTFSFDRPYQELRSTEGD